MNYFNYFTEVESEFVKRRGSHLLVSPLDWALIESWKQRGVPLHIVLRGISASFDGYDQRAQRGRKVNTLFFCQQEVEALYAEYCAAQVGANAPVASGVSAGAAAASNGHHKTTQTASPFSKERVLDYLADHAQTLAELQTHYANEPALTELFARAATRLQALINDLQETAAWNAETLESDLMLVEETLLTGLQASLSPAAHKALEHEAAKQLRAHKDKMEPAVYAQTLANFTARRLREQFHVPRLSLFYL